MREPGITAFLSERQYNIHRFAKEIVPAKVMGFVGSLPLIGSKNLKTTSENLLKLSNKMYEVQKLFNFFTTNTWIFESQFVERFIQADRKNCSAGGNLDVSIQDIDWNRQIYLWVYGVRKFFCKHDIIAPETQTIPLIEKN